MGVVMAAAFISAEVTAVADSMPGVVVDSVAADFMADRGLAVRATSVAEAVISARGRIWPGRISLARMSPVQLRRHVFTVAAAESAPGAMRTSRHRAPHPAMP